MAQQFTKVAKIQKQIQIEKSRRELVSLNTLLPEMTPEQTEEALMKMHKLCLLVGGRISVLLEYSDSGKRYLTLKSFFNQE